MMKNFQFKKNLQPTCPQCFARQPCFARQCGLAKRCRRATYNPQPNSGFTLVELLVVIVLLGFIGTITSQIFIINVRSQLKSEIFKEVKQNGDYALNVMEIMIKNAASVTLECGTPSNELTIMNPDGFLTTFTCTDGDKIASNSQTLTSNKVAVYNCTNAFRVVCPTPAISPKYIFVNFRIQQTGESLTPTPGSVTSLDYQTTISLRNYE